MLVITVSGKAEAGKDFLAGILKEKLESKGKKVIIVHYADYLKFISKQYFGWDGTKSEEGRKILQTVGTEIVRKRNPDFWVNIACMLLKVFKDDYDYAIIPDCRFPNEIEIMKSEFNTLSVNIIRLNYENHLTPEQRLHPSEVSLDNYNFDIILSAQSGREYVELEANNLLNIIKAVEGN